MPYCIGFDIGGTKIAGAIFNEAGDMLAEVKLPLPSDYRTFLDNCCEIVGQLEAHTKTSANIGVGVAGNVDPKVGFVNFAVNISYLNNAFLAKDLSEKTNRNVRIANDADCAALAEAVFGAGAGYDTVLGLIIGTGVGSALVVNGRLMKGANGLMGEIGHLPLPFREPEDGPIVECKCRQLGCIEKSIGGSGLTRLYKFMIGEDSDPRQIAELAIKKDERALRVLDRYYEIVAKAMVTAIHSFDPDIITVSGGLSRLPGLYEEVPMRWGKYTFLRNIKTGFVPAEYGLMSGMRGAAYLWNVE
ncbi:MAG: ROK family protein [Alphaproteobacteria bacterium]|nr:ROK family protein [Alphaproteobacteria bacterium]